MSEAAKRPPTEAEIAQQGASWVRSEVAPFCDWRDEYIAERLETVERLIAEAPHWGRSFLTALDEERRELLAEQRRRVKP